MCVYSFARANPLPVAGYLVFLFASPPEFLFDISSTTSWPNADESSVHDRNHPRAASPQISPKNLQPLSPSAGVHLAAVSNGSAPEYWTMHFLQRPSHSYCHPLVDRTAGSLAHPFAKLLQGEFGMLRLIGGVPSAPPKSAELSLSSSASYSLYDISGNGVMSTITATSGFHGSAAGSFLFMGRQIGGLPGALEGGPGGGLGLEDVGQLTG